LEKKQFLARMPTSPRKATLRTVKAAVAGSGASKGHLFWYTALLWKPRLWPVQAKVGVLEVHVMFNECDRCGKSIPEARGLLLSSSAVRGLTAEGKRFYMTGGGLAKKLGFTAFAKGLEKGDRNVGQFGSLLYC
jgi:hypothetical protein